MSDIRNTMSVKRTSLILLIEILSVFLVLAIFRWIPEKLIAARVASLSFVVESLLLLYLSKPIWGRVWNFTFPIVLIFLFLFVIPMAGFRWLSDQSFSQMSWLGAPAYQWHQWSSKFYYLVLAATIIDLLMAIFRALPLRDQISDQIKDQVREEYSEESSEESSKE